MPSDSKIIDPFSQSYHKVQIDEWSIIDNTRGSSVVSSSATQAHIRFNVSLKLYLNLSLLKWLNSGLERVSSFIHCVKRVRIRTYSGPHLPAFSRIRTEYGDIQSECRYLSVFSPNAGKCRKNADQNNSEYGHFLRSDTEWIINWK